MYDSEYQPSQTFLWSMFSLIAGLVSGLIFGNVAGYRAGWRELANSAVASGVARYEASPKTGEIVFTFVPPAKEVQGKP